MLMSKEEKQEALKKLSGKDLLENYIFQFTHFNPLDEELCELFGLIQAEILRRCKLEGEE